MPEATHRRRLNGAMRRCHDPRDPSFPNYGGRDIRLCEEWRRNLAAFLRYVRTLLGWDDRGLDMSRIDNERGCEPRNIESIPRRENLLARRLPTTEEALLRELKGQLKRLVAQRIRPASPCTCVPIVAAAGWAAQVP